VLILFVLIVKIPFRAFSFRPEFAELDIERGKFLVFVIAIWLCFCLIALFFQSKSQLGIRICLAGLVYIYALPTESVITPTLDNMHYTGENFGIWYNIFERNNLPYADFEVHRGILANVIPSYIANFLSPGNPELFSYSYLLIALLISTLFVLVFNKKIKFLFLIVILSL
jgi:hypothetical protein